MPVPFPSPRLAPLLVLCCLLLLIGGCTRPNPDFCCTSESECASLGVSDVRTCSEGQVCDSNVCLAAQCETATECTAEAPYCANQVCKATCAGDGDCVDAPLGPLCAEDGVCVGCKSNDDCGEDAPICSPTKRVCTPCRADADCASGVCLAADGRCAKENELIFLREGGNDNTFCTRSLPCYTFSRALDLVIPTRRVIRLLGASYVAAEGITINSHDVYIDAESTEIKRTTQGAILSFSGTGDATLEGVKLNVSTRIGVVITRTGTVRISQIQATGIEFENAVFVQTGTAKIWNSRFFNAWALCSTAKIIVEESEFQNGAVDGGSDCTGELRRNIFNDTRLTVSGGLIFQNNLVKVTTPKCYHQFYGGSSRQIDFNTWVCRSSPPASGPFEGIAFDCSPDDRFTGNLLAWDAVNPTPRCTLRHSLLPTFATAVPGENNQYVDMARVFVDYAGGDYHLSPTSPAREAGDPQSGVTVDLEGNPRPNPKGSAPDIGAFEAP
jgi:hypothetical protein